MTVGNAACPELDSHGGYRSFLTTRRGLMFPAETSYSDSENALPHALDCFETWLIGFQPGPPFTSDRNCERRGGELRAATQWYGQGCF
jgi:hypothetical protein